MLSLFTGGCTVLRILAYSSKTKGMTSLGRALQLHLVAEQWVGDASEANHGFVVDFASIVSSTCSNLPHIK